MDAQARLDSLNPGSEEWDAVQAELRSIQRAAADLRASAGTPPETLAYATEELLAPEPEEPEI
jgi:hypothetical protein